MTTDFSTTSSGGGTFTERARRAQLVAVTIELVADEGYGGASLSRIAARAGISKAAVLYHFSTKDALVQAAYEHTLAALTDEVARAVEAAAPADRPAAYVRSMIGHLREHPRHTRMLIEAMSHGVGEHQRSQRWQPLADLLQLAGVCPPAEARTRAIIIGGAIDGIVAESLQDPGYDTAQAADELVEVVLSGS